MIVIMIVVVTIINLVIRIKTVSTIVEMIVIHHILIQTVVETMDQILLALTETIILLLIQILFKVLILGELELLCHLTVMMAIGTAQGIHFISYLLFNLVVRM